MASVLIVDFGSQTTQLIARRVREAGVFCEMISCAKAEKKLQDMRPNAIIPSGTCFVKCRRITPASRVHLGARRACTRHLLRHAVHGGEMWWASAAPRQKRVRAPRDRYFQRKPAF